MVLPAPLAPIRSVRLRAGRARQTDWRPVEPSGKEYERFLTAIVGSRFPLGGIEEAIVGLMGWRRELGACDV